MLAYYQCVGVARKVLVVVLVILAVVAGVLAGTVYTNRPTAVTTPAPEVARPLSILFIGNSFTFVNDMPAMLKGLATSDGILLATTSHTPGGAQLVQQAANREVQRLLKDHWDYVVIQEQSQLPSIPNQLTGTTEPALRTLMGLAARSGSPTVLYETWGYRNGDFDNRADGDSYTAMQDRLDDGFAKLHASTGIDVIPVNRAWRRAHDTHPEIELWGPDNKHPAPAGTYLAACAFYNKMLKHSPTGNKFTAGLSAASTLQEIATSQ